MKEGEKASDKEAYNFNFPRYILSSEFRALVFVFRNLLFSTTKKNVETFGFWIRIFMCWIHFLLSIFKWFENLRKIVDLIEIDWLIYNMVWLDI